jgi:serine/threonine protein kinase
MRAASQAIESILAAAVEMESEAERRKFVDDACAGDVQLKERVLQLIENHFRAGTFLELPLAVLQGADGIQASVDVAKSEAPGTVIGPYKLLEQIGEGGFGLVFMAEQQHPVRRKVAVKVLKPGMDTRQVIARFEAERQALALMDHPNIARVLEAGETGTGRPFFAMELVRGVPITHYCDKSNLTTRERLKLFLTVCQAVQHAHLKGIIHRDLKPSNVMVTLHDGAPVVKVIDFGIAKAIGQQLTDKTLYTAFAQLVGTPLYMSPEQAEMSGLDVDTRSDIYSLGVLLYELLTGTTPFEKERLGKVPYDEMRRIIREEEPVRPSTRISTMGQAATPVSARRQSDPQGLSQMFRGELDWIVMKALEKNRNRRYETAASFAADVQRFLHDEPVLACPPSAWFRLRKLARRHRWALALAGGLALALVVFAAGSLIAGLFLNRDSQESESKNSPLDQWNRHRSAPLTIRALRVEHFADQGGTVEPRGQIGVHSFAARFGDHVRLSVELSEPAYAYLVALNPDGKIQLCWPANDRTTPHRTDHISYPGDGKSFDLNDEELGGLQAFVLLAARQSLPAFAEWRQKVPDLGWQRLHARPGVIWRGDAEHLDPVSQGSDGQRGTVSDLPGVGPLAEVVKTMRAAPGIDAVAMCAFAVEPKREQ